MGHRVWLNPRVAQPALQHPEGKPTVKQVYAIARGLCERAGEAWPETREEASALISRLRAEGEAGSHGAARQTDEVARRTR